MKQMRHIPTAALATTLLLTAAAHASSPAFQAAVAQANPLLWYKFNEQPGATEVINYGSLGAAYNGTAPNGVTFNAPTLGGDCGLRFSRLAGQYIQSRAVVPQSLTGNPTFTAETVVLLDPAAFTFGYPPFLLWGAPITGQSMYFSPQYGHNDRYYCGFYNGGLRTRCLTYRPGFWHHLVWTRVGGTDQWHGSHLYVDGVEVQLEQDYDLVGAPVINLTATPFYIQRATDANRFFDGAMDEIVLYPRVLSASEVADHYSALGAAATPPCLADYNGDCAVDFFDYLDFVNAFSVSAFGADFNNDGSIDFFDYLDFVDAFSRGC
jgi:hypothetical protein